jgi:hypothetical protein
MARARIAVHRLLAEKREMQVLQPGDIERLVRTAGQYIMQQFESVLIGDEE